MARQLDFSPIDYDLDFITVSEQITPNQCNFWLWASVFIRLLGSADLHAKEMAMI